MLRISSMYIKPLENVLKGFSSKLKYHQFALKQPHGGNRLDLQETVYFRSYKVRFWHTALNNETFVKCNQNAGRAHMFRTFHRTECRQAIPPWLIFALRPISKAIAVMFGRYLRRQWKAATPEERMKIVLKVKRNKNFWLGLLLLMTLGPGYFYISHLEEDPITKRRKFIMFDSKQLKHIADIELKVQTEIHKSHFLLTTHPLYQKLAGLVNHLLLANRDITIIKEKDWKITIVDAPEITNAFVLPNGTIFIFTGILNACSNDDQLGIILAHEIAHVVLSHMAEQISNAHLIDFLLVVPLVLLWTFLPDAAAFITHWLSNYITNLVIHLPFSRSLESEADTVGLQLAAKACFDVREASVFWRRMHMITENCPEADLEWLSTHPNGETRQQHLDSIMTEAISLREKAQCPCLPILDPRSMVPGILHMKNKKKQAVFYNVDYKFWCDKDHPCLVISINAVYHIQRLSRGKKLVVHLDRLAHYNGADQDNQP